MGLLQTWHVIWDQRAEGAETFENFQDHQVSGTAKINTAFQLKKSFVFLCIYFHRALFKKDKKCVISFCQILGLSQEPGCVPHELHEVHYQPAFSSLSLHCGVRSAGDAAFWRKVSKSLQGRQNWHPHFFYSCRGQLFFSVAELYCEYFMLRSCARRMVPFHSWEVVLPTSLCVHELQVMMWKQHQNQNQFY